MGIVSGGGGGKLPAQWAANPTTGALTITLTNAGDHDGIIGVQLVNSDLNQVWSVDSSGGQETFAQDTATHVGSWFTKPNNVTSFDVDNTWITQKVLPKLAGAGVHAAPADGDVNDGELAWWYDQTNGAAKLMLKGKTANGTVVTAAIALA